MANSVRYRTKHRQQILEYAKEMQGKHITANDVCEYFKRKGEKIGMATIYRQLDYLVQEGFLHKYTLDTTSSACFEYADEQSPAEYLHCKCTQCGDLIHLQCSELQHWNGHLQQNHGFQMDLGRTMLYGVCRQCGIMQ